MTVKKRKFAADTSVPAERSKGDIVKLLREWGCDKVGWQEDFNNGHISLAFVWTRGGASYGARMKMSFPTEQELRREPFYVNRQTGQVLEARIRKAMQQQGRSELRLLLLWLKAAFNAIDAGIIEPEVLFMPFFVTKDGETIAEAVLKDLPAIVGGKATIRQLTSG